VHGVHWTKKTKKPINNLKSNLAIFFKNLGFFLPLAESLTAFINS